MRCTRVLLLVAALFLALAPTVAFAAEPRAGQNVVVGPDEVVDDDLYAFGGTVDILGTVRGDVVAAGGTINISGAVTGNVLAFGGNTNVAGEVGGSVRAVSGQITVDGSVGNDVAVAGGTLSIGRAARVGRDVLVAGGTTTLDGQVTRNVLLEGGDVTINSQVGGYVRGDVGTVSLGSNAKIGGDLTYTSDRDAEISPGAQVKGAIQRHPAQRYTLGGTGWSWGAIFWLQGLVGMFVLGLMMVLIFPTFSRRTVDTVGRMGWVSLAVGFALFFGVPIAGIVLFVIGLFVGIWWLALMAMVIWGLAVPVSFVVAALSLGYWILRWAGRPGAHLLLALLLGLVILMLAALVPCFGALVVLVTILFGLGSLTLTVAWVGRTSAEPTGG